MRREGKEEEGEGRERGGRGGKGKRREGKEESIPSVNTPPEYAIENPADTLVYNMHPEGHFTYLANS